MTDKTILVIEDDEINMKLTLTLLKKGNFKILEAKDAQTGLKLVREHLPDLVLMDIQLPDMDGLKATQIIKEDPALKDIPIVAVSAYAMDRERKKGLDAGCVGYLTKPINTRTFLNTIEHYLT